MRRISSQPQLLLWIDRYVGTPLCFAFTVLHSALGRRRGGAVPAPRSILFLKLAEQGSTVLAYDALSAAAHLVGRDNVYFLAFEENRFVVDLLGVIPPQNVLPVVTRTPVAMLASTLKLLRQIRRKRIDACIDMEFFTRASALLGILTGARIRVGFHTYFGEGPYRGNLLTHRMLYNPHLHAAETFLSLVRALDIPPDQFPTFGESGAAGALGMTPGRPAPPFLPLPQERAAVVGILNSAAGAAELPARLVLLNANCSDLLPLRKWADSNYVSLAQGLLAADSEVAIAFTGSTEEMPRVAQLAAAVGSPRAFSVAGRTTLRELLVLYCLADILITNDSGPAHFAGLTPIDVIALFGPETPLIFGARGPRSHPLWAGIPCSPCVNAFNTRQSACRNNVCMQQITVDQVARLAAEILAQRAPS
jgi:ADP-heptose:LPS heptosyltransferase